MKSMFDALNIVYKEREKHGFVKLNLLALAFTGGAILFVLVALGGIIVLPALFSWMGATGPMAVITKIARWPVLLTIITVALAVLYRYGPNRSEAQCWGSAFAAIAWIVVSILFSWYAENYGSYNRTYGSVGSWFGFGSRPPLSLSAPNLMPKWSTRPGNAGRPQRLSEAPPICYKARHASSFYEARNALSPRGRSFAPALLVGTIQDNDGRGHRPLS
jgi:hypothetical protein